MLSKEEILGRDDLIIEQVEVPEWGGVVYVRTLSGEERDNFEQSLMRGPGKVSFSNIRAKFCALTICDEQGNRIFDDSDVTTLGRKSAKALDRIFAKAQELNGLGPGDIDQLEKNSGIGLSEDSIFD